MTNDERIQELLDEQETRIKDLTELLNNKSSPKSWGNRIMGILGAAIAYMALALIACYAYNFLVSSLWPFLPKITPLQTACIWYLVNLIGKVFMNNKED